MYSRRGRRRRIQNRFRVYVLHTRPRGYTVERLGAEPDLRVFRRRTAKRRRDFTISRYLFLTAALQKENRNHEEIYNVICTSLIFSIF